MSEIEKLKTGIIELTDRLTIQEKEFFYLKTKVETKVIDNKVNKHDSHFNKYHLRAMVNGPYTLVKHT